MCWLTVCFCALFSVQVERVYRFRWQFPAHSKCSSGSRSLFPWPVAFVILLFMPKQSLLLLDFYFTLIWCPFACDLIVMWSIWIASCVYSSQKQMIWKWNLLYREMATHPIHFFSVSFGKMWARVCATATISLFIHTKSIQHSSSSIIINGTDRKRWIFHVYRERARAHTIATHQIT